MTTYKEFTIKRSGKLFKVTYPDGRPFTMRFVGVADAMKAIDGVVPSYEQKMFNAALGNDEGSWGVYQHIKKTTFAPQ